MKFIGITGGVGAGKSAILSYLAEKPGVRVMLADEIAHKLIEPSGICYPKLQQVFAEDDLFLPDGRIARGKMAALLFSDPEKRRQMNGIVHPAVKQYIKKAAEEERRQGVLQFLILEAALLIEEHYDEICDELWYIYTREEIREQRLAASRGYSHEKVQQIFASQLREETYRKHCTVVIDNNGSVEESFRQIDRAIDKMTKKQEIPQMNNARVFEQPLVFGLDIGTRNVVGTVGYQYEKEFIVVAQCVMEHETRAMLDGQIHDIGRVGRTINRVKEELEKQTGQPLTEVCIAAAGRVLKTVTINITHEFQEETVVTGEDIHTLDLMGIEKAQGILKEMNDTSYKFYCVGYSVVKYYLNDEVFSNIESHKADKIGEDVIVTFLPEDVVDGLYAAVGQADLAVANMTLEPIAAINVAIPENYRLLNIALVDIGAGTSDISITRDGSIIAYGMIPLAGDEITELIVQHYLVDFNTAEYIKLASGMDSEITYKDIMLIEHKISAKEVWELTEPVVDKMTTEVASKIKELNGDQTVSATFIVGGGGKIHGYTEMLAKKLDLPEERVALRGEEVLQEVTFEQTEIKKDPLLVTPIGICLNYYDQRNSFIMVRFNGERIKLYDNNKLTIVDAALQAGFPNEDLFPKRGKELQFTVNGAARIVRGEQGESAAVYMNDRQVHINTPLEPNSEIIIEPSTKGEPASCTLEQLEEYTSATVAFVVNGRLIRCPKFLEVNGSLELPSYQIAEGDEVETRNFYTVGQLAEFMDVQINLDYQIVVNNRVATLDTLIYENFTIEWTVLSYGAAGIHLEDLEVADLPFLKQNEAAEPGAAALPKSAGQEEGSAAKESADEKSGAKADAETTVDSMEKNAKAGTVDANVPAGEAVSVNPGIVSETPMPAKTETENAASVNPGIVSETPVPAETETENAASVNPEIVSERPATPTTETGNAVTINPESVSKAAQSGKTAAEVSSDSAGNAGVTNPASNVSPSVVMPQRQQGITIPVYVNQQPVHLEGKNSYIFVDIFDFYEFDLTASAGRSIITNLNGQRAQFSAALKAGDQIELGWKEN